MQINLSDDPTGTRGRRGFTLLELMAVVSCVGVVVAIAFPSLDAAVRESRQALCTKRMFEIGQASLIYSERDVFNAAIPINHLQFQQDPANPTFIGAYEWGGKSGVGRIGFTERFYTHFLSSRYGTNAGFGPADRPLNEILYGHRFPNYRERNDRIGMAADTKLNLDKYRCPADDGPPLGDTHNDVTGPHCADWIVNPERTSFDHFGNSYAANIFMVETFGTFGGEIFSNSPYLRAHSRVPNPARTIYYEENIGRWAWAAPQAIDGCTFLAQGLGPTGAIRGWHGKDWRYNHSFGDGHVAMQTIYNEGTEKYGFATHYRNEELGFYPSRDACCQSTDVGCDTGSGGSFDSFRCIIVRGDGWQKDTLPAPLICTGLTDNSYGRASFDGCLMVND